MKLIKHQLSFLNTINIAVNCDNCSKNNVIERLDDIYAIVHPYMLMEGIKIGYSKSFYCNCVKCNKEIPINSNCIKKRLQSKIKIIRYL